MFDIDVMVIDPENEYEYLAEAVPVEDILKFLFRQNAHINPFDLPVPRG